MKAQAMVSMNFLYKLYLVHQLHIFLRKLDLTRVILGLVSTSMFEYINTLYLGTQFKKCSETSCGAKIGCQISPLVQITPVIFSLHWLPVPFYVPFKVLVSNFEAINSLGMTARELKKREPALSGKTHTQTMFLRKSCKACSVPVF